MRRMIGCLLGLVLGAGVAAEPVDVETQMAAGFEALARGELDEAEASFRQAQLLQPRNVVVLVQLARIHLQRDEHPPAIGLLRRAIDLDPDAPAISLELAAVYSRLLSFADARQTLRRLLERRPDEPEAYSMLASVAQQEMKWEEAEHHLRKYLELAEAEPVGLTRLGATLVAQEKYEEAEPLLQQSLEADPGQGHAHYSLGLLYSRQGKQLEARQHLARAAQLAPDHPRTHHHLGTVLTRLGDLAGAEKVLRRAIELEPDTPGSYYALGMVLRRLGRAEEAEQMLAAHVQLESSVEEERRDHLRLSSLQQEILALLKGNRLEDAERKVGEILDTHPQNHVAYYRRAQIHYLRRDFEGCLPSVEAALDLSPVQAPYLVLAGMCREALGREMEARDAYERVLLMAEYPDAYFRLGQLELRHGQAEKAAERLRQAVDLQPRNPIFRMALADALERAGHVEEGREQRDQARFLREEGPAPQ